MNDLRPAGAEVGVLNLRVVVGVVVDDGPGAMVSSGGKVRLGRRLGELLVRSRSRVVEEVEDDGSAEKVVAATVGGESISIMAESRSLSQVDLGREGYGGWLLDALGSAATLSEYDPWPTLLAPSIALRIAISNCLSASRLGLLT